MQKINLRWKNGTGITNYVSRVEDFLGFIYLIELENGEYYVGRKQFWAKRGNGWIENDWREYCSSSKTIQRSPDQIIRKTILAIFKSKSAIRFAEAYGIINSGAYLDSDKGLNWSFEGSRGTIKMDEEDTEQLRRLMSWCLRWKKKQDKEKTEE